MTHRGNGPSAGPIPRHHRTSISGEAPFFLQSRGPGITSAATPASLFVKGDPMRRTVTRILLAPLAFACGATAHANTPAADTGCAAPESRQFDFWIGDWDVFGPAGKLVGT